MVNNLKYTNYASAASQPARFGFDAKDSMKVISIGN